MELALIKVMHIFQKLILLPGGWSGEVFQRRGGRVFKSRYPKEPSSLFIGTHGRAPLLQLY
jgi:hypothetical protein